MVRFIVEVDEELIHQKANPDAFLESDALRRDGLSAIIEHACYRRLEEEIKDGNVDPVITKDSLQHDAADIFENTIAKLGALATICRKEEQPKKQY